MPSPLRIRILVLAALLAPACGKLKMVHPDAGGTGGGVGGTGGTGGFGGASDAGVDSGRGDMGGASDGQVPGTPDDAGNLDAGVVPEVGADDAGVVPPSACSGTPPRNASIIGGSMLPVSPQPFTFAASGLTGPTVTVSNAADGTIQALQVVANPGATTSASGAFLGFGMGFSMPACLDASAYDSVTFTIAGDLGTCRMTFSVLISEDNAVGNGPYGRCTAASCYPPSSRPLAVGENVARFAEFTGGSPVTVVDPAALNGVQWTMTVPTDGTTAPCTANFTISNVRFTVAGAPPPETTDGGIPDGAPPEEAGVDAPEEAGSDAPAPDDAGDDASDASPE